MDCSVIPIINFETLPDNIQSLLIEHVSQEHSIKGKFNIHYDPVMAGIYRLQRSELALPIEVVAKIFRSDKDLFLTSRTVSKKIIELSTDSILSNEGKLHISAYELSHIQRPIVFELPQKAFGLGHSDNENLSLDVYQVNFYPSNSKAHSLYLKGKYRQIDFRLINSIIYIKATSRTGKDCAGSTNPPSRNFRDLTLLERLNETHKKSHMDIFTEYAVYNNRKICLEVDPNYANSWLIREHNSLLIDDKWLLNRMIAHFIVEDYDKHDIPDWIKVTDYLKDDTSLEWLKSKVIQITGAVEGSDGRLMLIQK